MRKTKESLKLIFIIVLSVIILIANATFVQAETESPVTFNTNGGSYVSHQDVMEGDTAYRPNNPTKACSRFVGWYTNSSLTNLSQLVTTILRKDFNRI